MVSVAACLRACRSPGGCAGSAAGCRGEEAGQAEQAQQRPPVRGCEAAEGDRGVRAGGHGGQRVAQRRAGRLRLRHVTARGQGPETDHRVLAHRAYPGSEAAQPAAHGGGWDAQVRAPIRAVPVPWSADAAAAVTMTPTASARRDAIQDGSRMCVAWHEPHRPLRGLSRALAPPRSRITRSRRGLTAAAAPPRKTVRPARQTPGPRTRHRRTAARQQVSRSRQHDLPKAAGRQPRPAGRTRRRPGPR
jgi:hypothetical protein